MKLENRIDASIAPPDVPGLDSPRLRVTALPSPTSPDFRTPFTVPDPLLCSARRPAANCPHSVDAGGDLEGRIGNSETSSASRHDLGPRPTLSLVEPLSPPTTSTFYPPLHRTSPEGLSLSSTKRPSEAEKRMTPTFESPFKKPRLAPPGSLSLPPITRDPGDLEAADLALTALRPYSTSSSKHMAVRPTGIGSLDLTASLMGTVHEHHGITTLRLPKGQVSVASAASPARSSGTPGSWSSGGPSTMSRSPEGRPLASPAQVLQGIGIAEFLDNDQRPTFVVDLDDPANFESGPLHLVFTNAALRAARETLQYLQFDTADPDHSPEFSRFKSWILAVDNDRESLSATPQSMEYGGVKWVCSTARRRFRFVCGNTSIVSLTPTSPGVLTHGAAMRSRGRRELDGGREDNNAGGDYFGTAVPSPGVFHGSLSDVSSRPGTAMDESMTPMDELAHPEQLQTTFDWTRIPLDDPNLTPHHRLARSVDWVSTSLGPVEDWPSDLRIMSNMIMGSPHPAAMYWGHDHVAIYNEAYTTLTGSKHPNMMGKKYEEGWSEIWDDIRPTLKAAWNNGDATMKYDDLLFLTRHGFLEETYFNWAIIPLVGGDGNVVAVYNPAFENTRRKINERRMLTLREVGVKTAQACDVKSFWRQVQKGLEYNEYDVPFALIYSVVDGDNESDVSSMHSSTLSGAPQIVLEGSIGVPDGHPVAVPNIDLKSNEDGFAPYLRESIAYSSNPIVLSEDDGTLPSDLLHGLAWRGFGDPCRTIIVFPVHPTTAIDSVVGFMILGVNPRRTYDTDYQLFFNLLERQLATSMASVVLLEEEIKRGQRAARQADLDKQHLSQQLHLRTQEAAESENRFTRMADFGPVGMFITDGTGRITYCNEMWWKISGHDRSTSTVDAWMQSIRDEDRPGVESAWRLLVEEKAAVTHEFRFKGSRRLQDGHSVDKWSLMSAYPEKDEHGILKSIFGCITDISQQKWAEDFQKQRREEAVELKRQQENFIDITSHEMRNPLSAILQCADEIASSLNRYKMGDSSSYGSNTWNTLVDSCMEAANTIALCASHQKRIVDDILTLSKLDSNLLLVTPVDVQPVVVVRNVLRMFESELNSNDIKGQFQLDRSYKDLAVDWVKLDPSRLRQVLINLMTNAIKFTQGRPSRSIVISLGASKDVASVGMAYIPARYPNQEDVTDGPDWADGEKLNLHVAVTDTGPGLDDDEKKILFQRFSQVSPRTHVQYGGSGLGLFICRTLTEKQGGQISVESQKGEGSTFAFYIKVRRANNPRPDLSATVPTPQISATKPPAPVSPTQQLTRPPVPSVGILQAVPSATMLAPGTDAARVLDVLIVEDNLVNQKVLQRQLQLSGNKTHVANHGGEALQALRQSRFWDEEKAAVVKGSLLSWSCCSGSGGDKENRRNISVILMDLEMPVMDGMTCTSEIRRLESEGVITQHIPIIAVTAYARPEQVENAKAAGVDDVISKPFRIPELIPKIEELVAKYNMLPHGLDGRLK